MKTLIGLTRNLVAPAVDLLLLGLFAASKPMVSFGAVLKKSKNSSHDMPSLAKTCLQYIGFGTSWRSLGGLWVPLGAPRWIGAALWGPCRTPGRLGRWVGALVVS